jgi:4-hydroxy-3-methylbut-2-en-1-yl diphosphate synthase IspG/GcpE
MEKVHFKEDSRHVVVAENFERMEDAEKAVDAFLQQITELDEAGTHYLRVQVSGKKDADNYYFKVCTQC